jgi:hypothetical protein
MSAAQKTKADPVAPVSALRTSQSSLDHKPDQKHLATLVARLALAGHAVHKGREQEFIVCKWGMSRWCADFASLQAFAKQLGVKQ